MQANAAFRESLLTVSASGCYDPSGAVGNPECSQLSSGDGDRSTGWGVRNFDGVVSRPSFFHSDIYLLHIPAPDIHPHHVPCLVDRRMDPRAAVLTGKLSIRGDVGLAARLGEWMYTVVARRAAAGEQLEVAPRDQWEKDKEAAACAVCRQEFFKVCLCGSGGTLRPASHVPAGD